MRYSVGDLIDRLSIVNIKIALLESDLRQGKEGRMSLQEVGERALMVRTLNNERVAVKKALNQLLDSEAFNDVKVNYTRPDA
jgi:hypothetical protein